MTTWASRIAAPFWFVTRWFFGHQREGRDELGARKRAGTTLVPIIPRVNTPTP